VGTSEFRTDGRLWPPLRCFIRDLHCGSTGTCGRRARRGPLTVHLPSRASPVLVVSTWALLAAGQGRPKPGRSRSLPGSGYHHYHATPMCNSDHRRRYARGVAPPVKPDSEGARRLSGWFGLRRPSRMVPCPGRNRNRDVISIAAKTCTRVGWVWEPGGRFSRRRASAPG
jgi:hypothetical protein